jgi:hypothetical protein
MAGDHVIKGDGSFVMRGGDETSDEKLKQYSASAADQILHYWLPGEVQVLVLLARPDSKDCAYATNVTSRERLLHLLGKVREQSEIQTLMVKSHKLKR